MIERLTLSSPISDMHGVGKTRALRLNKLGIFTVRDLIFHFPRAYENRGDIKELKDAADEFPHSYILTVASTVTSAKLKNHLTISKFRAFDDSGSCEVVFFNSPFVKDIFSVGSTFRFYGKTNFSKNGKMQLTAPKYEAYVDGIALADYLPIYSLTDGINSKFLDKLIKTANETLLSCVADPLPEQIRLDASLPTLRYAISNIHSPKDLEALDKAKRRLAFDEMLKFGLGIAISTERKRTLVGVLFKPTDMKHFTDVLPYELTGAQKRVINDIYRDTVLTKNSNSAPCMARIVVGDVGSGKTVCAAAAIYLACRSGYQSAFMAPTEILAHQHYEDLAPLFKKLGIKTALLTGSTKQSEKNAVYKKVFDGEIDCLIGTHALLSDKLMFHSLGLIITDEQHRFGVAQRGVLKDKTSTAHMLVMSATPIPRSLALAMYGDLDVSRIDEMPKGRMRVDTYLVNESYRTRLNEFIKKQILLGGQCYVVCPSIEKSEESDEFIFGGPMDDGLINSASLNLKNAVDYTKDLQKSLPGITVECLHGKMKNAEKDEIMSRFQSGEINVLVSTTVIEVGVNVPNATLMVVENAERFGLSQLHQLRGRVGRGNKKSYCILVSDATNEKATSRLNVIKTTYDGYEIAEKDLLQRGPGDFFSQNNGNSLRQSGGFEFKLAKLCNDPKLFDMAFLYAKQIIKRDPTLSFDEHLALKEDVYSILNNASDIS